MLSDCGKYRYALWRDIPPRLGELRPIGTCLFVMLNPSTADASEDDPTIRRCIGFAERWGFARLAVGNLFAFRATDPRDLGRTDDPVGPDNYSWLERLVAEAGTVVAAWGASAGSAGRGEHLGFLPDETQCLGLTKAGHPRHPLYVRGDAELIPYAPPVQ